MNFTSYSDLFRAALSVPDRPAPSPFPYQVAFAEGAALPSIVRAPTGAGKTAAAILGWLWRRRFHADPSVRAETPRRLVFCLPMRTLVEQTVTVARLWLERLGLADEVCVYKLMGGAVEDKWEGHPEREVILVGTQDQLLSRALNRGYAMSRYLWPVHFALINSDCLWILDEVQLMGPALSTSAQLQAFRDALGTHAPTRSVWMSATMAVSRLRTIDHRAQPLEELPFGSADLADPVLGARHRAAKPLGAAAHTHRDVDKLAKEIVAAHQDGSLTLAIMNQVPRARALFAAIAKLTRGKIEVRLLHSRFRPIDRARIQTEVLAPKWSGILISTQAVEAGVDISARTLFTEVAPWSSLVQRFGRCNRVAEYTAAECAVRWIDVADDDAAPYTADELTLSRGRLAGFEDVSPASLARVPEDDAQPALPVIRRRDLLELFDTQPDLAGHDLDISRYIRDGDDRDVQVAWRDLDGKPPASDAADLQRDELCSVPIAEAIKFLKGSTAYRWSGLTSTWERARSLAPGMAVQVDAKLGGYSPDLGWTGSSSDHPAPVDLIALSPDADEREALSYDCREFVTLRTHSVDVTEEAQRLRETVGGSAPWDTIVRACTWHDLGKAHPVFAEMIVSGLAADDARRQGGPWAKSDGTRGRRARRRGFRHELASALAFLGQGGDDLTAYLIAAHHGKVRMTLRAQPTEIEARGQRRDEVAPPDTAFAHGVFSGDQLPAIDLGVEQSAAVTLDLSIMSLGLGANGPSWSERMGRVLGAGAAGPFRLAFWEAMVRIADWRGTARHTARNLEVIQ